MAEINHCLNPISFSTSSLVFMPVIFVCFSPCCLFSLDYHIIDTVITSLCRTCGSFGFHSLSISTFPSEINVGGRRIILNINYVIIFQWWYDKIIICIKKIYVLDNADFKKELFRFPCPISPFVGEHTVAKHLIDNNNRKFTLRVLWNKMCTNYFSSLIASQWDLMVAKDRVRRANRLRLHPSAVLYSHYSVYYQRNLQGYWL